MNGDTCICCKSRRSVPYVAGLRQCETCTHVWADTKISDEMLSALYGECYFRGDEYLDYELEANALRRNFRRRVKELSKLHRRGSYLWEIGAAYGYFLDEASFHFRVGGCDVSEFAAQRAREMFSLDVWVGDYLSMRLPEPCAVICLWDTLEHLRDPQLLLEKTHRDLRTGGTLALTTGDVSSTLARWRGAKWRLIHPPTHLHYFSPSSLTTLLERLGFAGIQIRYFPFWRSADAIAHRLQNGSRSTWCREFYQWVHRRKVLNFAFPVNTFDIMTVHATNDIIA